MTGHEVAPIPPPMLGDVIANPGAYAEAIAAQTLSALFPSFPAARSPRVRRARRGAVRRLAVRVAVVAAVTVSVVGCGGSARASVRPVWDGRSPHVWTSEADPVCWRSILGRHGWARAGEHGPRFRVVCQRDGSEYAWAVVTGSTR